ncbi:LysR family transcriptional regulator [Paraburkholderia sp. SARCC-3016]|uniref:LysR family transcriptional regulator n=1 Tax=Paraburkholderia sp. SARCC-3016 TaxID=3058611 RepID=UPI0028072AE5|nr:LysR family transcriptional regulator [Paraburkholderia sp. SARCC-3016]MDQ7980972.1 LysR family transcriptional regulator [Paraburkholderia sp. SARCC-3016]
MDQLLGMRVFIRVVESKGFSIAAKELGMSAAAVTRSVNMLEAHLNVRLLNRSTRSVSLTDIGEQYLDDCRKLVRMLDDMDAKLIRTSRAKQGVLRIGISAASASSHVCDVLAAYHATQAPVTFDVRSHYSSDDFRADRFDVSFTDRRYQPASSQISRTLLTFDEGLTASRDYLANHGVPTTPTSLAVHRLLMVADRTQRTWDLTDGSDMFRIEPLRSVLRVPSYSSARIAAVQGMGIALLPLDMISEELHHGTLVRVLPSHMPPASFANGVSIVYSGRTRQQVRVRQFIDFSIQFFRGSRYRMR